MRSAPHWKGGGIVFGPHPRDYSLSLPKKMRRKALLSALSAKVADGGIIIVEDSRLRAAADQSRRVAVLNALKSAGDRRVLMVLDAVDRSRSCCPSAICRNVAMTTAEMLGTYDVLLADRLLFTHAGDTTLPGTEATAARHGALVRSEMQGGAA